MNGKIVFTRRVNLGNYEHKECSADISYTVDDDQDWLHQKGIVDRAADLAEEVVERKLGLNERIKRADVLKKPEPEQSIGHRVADAFGVPRKPEPVVQLADKPNDEYGKTFTKMDPLSEDWALVADPLASAGVVSAPSAPVNGAASGSLADPLAVGAEPSSGPAADTLADLDAELAAIPREVSNDELENAARSYVMRHGKPGYLALRRMKDKYTETQIVTIPQERRLAFLGELAELTP